MSMPVCLSAYIARTPDGRTSQKCFVVLPMAVARFSSGGVVLSYVLPVLWATPFHKMAVWRGMCVVNRKQNMTSTVANSPAKSHSTTRTMQQVYLSRVSNRLQKKRKKEQKLSASALLAFVSIYIKSTTAWSLSALISVRGIKRGNCMSI